MCGILTVVAKAGPLDLRACRRGLSRLSWRGPDRCVPSVWNERVFLGQTVLSLTGDVTNADDHYVESQSGRYAIAFNGEIYNFRELAARWLGDRITLTPETTDTEVLVNLHDVLGPGEIPAHLDGMYAYTVLDRHARHLYVARDVQGEKSVFIHDGTDQVIVASEIPAILSLVRDMPLDVQALRDYFRTRHFMLFDRTAYRGIRQILPGRVERFDLDSGDWTVVAHRRLRDWIDPARHEANERRSLDDLADELDALLERCVAEMLPARQKFAVVVSGGVDSSLLASYIVPRGNPTTLVAVDHIGKDLISSDLSGFERVLRRPIDVLHVNEVPYAAEIVRCQQTCGGPLPAHSFVPQALQSAHVRNTGCRIMFGGEAGDELFGGYDAYLNVSGASGRFSPSPYLSHSEPEVRFERDCPERVQTDLADAWTDSVDAYAHVADESDRGVLAAAYGDAAYQLPPVGLRGADLMSMMWSLEARTVLLRRPIASFALNLPAWAKVDRGAADPNLRTKVLLKKLFLRKYPAGLLMKKQGFAGFPNESAAYLGDRDDYLAYDVLGIHRDNGAALSRAADWKLANVEYFLRSRAI
jgi:asparagine synthase (glutamine-hydrolysing)